MKWLASLFHSETTNTSRQKIAPISAISTAGASLAKETLCACCERRFSTEDDNIAAAICGNCGADAAARLTMSVIRYASRLAKLSGQSVLLIEPPEPIFNQLSAISGLRVISANLDKIANAASPDDIDALDAAIISKPLIGTPEECDAIQNIYGLLRDGGWMLMRGASGYYAEQSGFAVYENNSSNIKELPPIAAAGLDVGDAILFCIKQSSSARAAKASDKERVDLKTRNSRNLI